MITVKVVAHDKPVSLRKWFHDDKDRADDAYHIMPGASYTIQIWGDQQLIIEESNLEIIFPVNDGVGG